MAYDNLSDAEKRQAIKDAMSPMVMISLKAKKKRPVESDDTDEKPQQTAGVGTISSVDEREAERDRPAHAVVQIRHGEKPKPKSDSNNGAQAVESSWPLSSSVIVSIEDGKKYSVGQKCKIVLEPVGSESSEYEGEE